MAIRHDPEDQETKALLDLAGDLTGKRVLEIGCGHGRLTWRYAGKAAHVTAIDPNPDKIKRAIREIPDKLRDKVTFQTVSLEQFVTLDRFDLAILSWSL